MEKAQNPWEKYINDSTLESVYGDIDVIYRIFGELGASIKELEIPRSLGLLSDGLDHIEDINYNTISKMVEIKKNFYDYNDSIDQIDYRYKAKLDELGVPSLETVEMNQFVPTEALISTGAVASTLDVSGEGADAVETDGVNTENIEDVDLVDPNGGNSNNNNNNDDDYQDDDIIIVTSPPEQRTTPHEVKTTPVVDDGDGNKLKLSDALGILGGVAIASGAAVGAVAAAKAAKKKKEEKEEDSVWEN
jgi:hypothetical protein